jgi:iron complex outermembrane receptor protein
LVGVDPSVAAAADAAAGPPTTAAQSAPQDALEEIVVTGTLIHGVAPVGSDLISVSRTDIEQTGAATVSDVLATVPQMANFLQSQKPGIPGAEDGTNPPNLRGLNPGATLSLVNGHRMVGAGIEGTTFDPNAIPALALERVEIVPDGASSLYGSDAIAGVVNFITRKDLQGAETSLRYGAADSYHASDLGQAFGTVWSTGSAMLTYEYSQNTDLTGNERPAYYSVDRRPFGGNDLRATNCPLPNVTVPGSSTNYAFPGLAPNTVNYCDSVGPTDLLWANSRNSVFGTVRQQLGGSIELWANVSWSDRNSRGLVASPAEQATIANTNPYFQAVPGTGATSETVTFRADDLVGADYTTDRSDATSGELVTGLDFKLPHDWRATAYGNLGRSDATSHEPQSLNGTALATAAAGTTPGTALDPFGPGTGPAVAAGIDDFDFYNHARQNLYEGVVNADGPLVQLPGGPLKLAVGAEYRKEEFTAEFHEGPIEAPTSSNTAVASRTVSSGYAELFVPIVGKDNALPLVKSLDISASARHDGYSDFGSTNNPKFGLNWTVVDGFTLRGSYGKSFHAPNLSDLHAIDGKFVTVGYPVSLLYLGADPKIPAGYNAYVLAGGNPALQAERARTFSFGVDFQPAALPGLHATATYYNIDYSNIVAVPPLGSSALFTDPAFSRFIYRNPSPALLSSLSAGLPPLLLVPINPALPTTLFDLRRQNLGVEDTDGIDFNINYHWSSAIGEMSTGVAGEWILKYDIQASPTSPASNQFIVSATGGTPKYRARGNLGWSNGPYAATMFINYNGAYNNELSVNSGGISSYTANAYVTADLHLGYSLPDEGWTRGTQLSIDVENLFDAEPPVTPAGPRTDVSVIGREVWLGVRKHF